MQYFGAKESSSVWRLTNDKLVDIMNGEGLDFVLLWSKRIDEVFLAEFSVINFLELAKPE